MVPLTKGESWITYKDRRRFSDTFLPAWKHVLAPLVILEASHEQDTQQATDLISHSLRFAVRTRRAEHATKYGDQFTVRYPGEFQKILDGWGDYMGYGFGDEATGQLTRFRVIDLSVFRDAINKDGDLLKGKYFNTNRGKAGTAFYAWGYDLFPDSMVVLSEGS